MAEPKIGMKFGSYLKNDRKMEAKASGVEINSYKAENAEGKPSVFTVIYKNKAGETMGYSTLSKYENGNDEACLFGDDFAYTGSGKSYDNDIKYTRISGERTYAIDLNNNGIVDKGEIFKY